MSRYHGAAMSTHGDILYTVDPDDGYAVEATIHKTARGPAVEVVGARSAGWVPGSVALNVPAERHAPAGIDPVAWLGSADGAPAREWIAQRLKGIRHRL